VSGAWRGSTRNWGTGVCFVALAFPDPFAIQLINRDEEEEKKQMTQESNSSPGKAGGEAGPFPPAEVETLHSLDREAARNIVCLLGGLFIVGLILYIFVAIWVY